MTQCTQQALEFHHLGRREVTAKFDAPAITSDAGGLLLREVNEKFQFINQFASCFDDYRSPHFTIHSLQELLSQRIFGIALGYEDLNDHEQLRHDPLMAVLAGKTDPAPQDGFAYKSYCYLPLYIFCGSHLLCAKLRPSNIDAAAGSVRQLDRIVSQIRARWPKVQIVIRGDSGFCRDNLMSWCESNQVQYVLGLAEKHAFEANLGKELHQAKQLFQASGEACASVQRLSLPHSERAGSCERRVIGKAEHLAKGEKPSRFVVTNLPSDEVRCRRNLRKRILCSRRHGESNQRTTALPVRRSY